MVSGEFCFHLSPSTYLRSDIMLRLTKFLKICEGMGLWRTRQQMHTVETIHEVMTDLRLTYPNAGAREMVSLLFHKQNMSVAR